MRIKPSIAGFKKLITDRKSREILIIILILIISVVLAIPSLKKDIAQRNREIEQEKKSPPQTNTQNILDLPIQAK